MMRTRRAPLKADKHRLVEQMQMVVPAETTVEESLREIARFPHENPAPVLRIAQDGALLYANPASQPVLDLWHSAEGKGKVPANILDVVRTALQEKTPRTVRVLACDRLYALLAVPVADRGYVNLYGRDITEQVQAEEALRESEARFRIMADSTPVMIWVTDRNGEIAMVNKAYEEFFGIKEEDLRRPGGWQELVHPDDAPRYAENLRTAIKERRGLSSEGRVRHKSGQWRWIQVYASPRFSPSGDFLGMVGSSPDITDRKAAEEALRQSEARFRLALQHTDLVAWRCDTDLKVTWMFNSYLGFQAEEFVGKTAEELMGVEPAREIMALRREVLETGLGIRRTIRYTFPDREYYFDNQVQPLRDEHGQITGLIGFGLDITQRVVLERRLAQREENLRVMVEHAEQPIMLVNENGVIEGVNGVGAFVLGFEEAELVGKNVEQLVDLTSRLELAMRLEDLRRYAPMPARATLRIKARDGKVRWMNVEGTIATLGRIPEKFLIKFEPLEGFQDNTPR